MILIEYNIRVFFPRNRFFVFNDLTLRSNLTHPLQIDLPLQCPNQ